MSYQISETDPRITCEIADFEKNVATFLKTANITTQAAYDTAVNGLTAAQQTAAVKALLRSFKVDPPSP